MRKFFLYAFLFLLTLSSASVTLVILLTDFTSTQAVNKPLVQNITSSNHENPTDLQDYFADKGVANAVLGAKSDFSEILSQPATVSATIVSSASAKFASKSASLLNNTSASARKSFYTVAVLGDSMVDTLGSNLPNLKSALKKRFPNVNFVLFNFGVGGINIEEGERHLNNAYSYLGDPKPPLLSINPDIVVVESFAYNHWDNTKSDLDRQWLTIARIITAIKNNNKDIKIVLAAAIAPFCPTYTDGSANLPQDRKYSECATVKAYLQNMVNFATSQHYPLADAYHASLNGIEGNPVYINQGDHIHPSEAGKQLFSDKVADAIERAL